MKIRFQQFEGILKLVRLFFAGALLITFIAPSWTRAQSATEQWSSPFNLSHSGVAMNPSIVIDSDANVHAIWQDELANFFHARLSGEQWSPPSATELNLLFDMPALDEPQALSPSAIYAGPNPLFMAGPTQEIFAFWVSDEANLYASKVRNQNFEDITAWDGRNLVASGVASFAVFLDAGGELHLAFVRTSPDPVDPPGIYYTRSKNSGRTWAVPVLLYESPYLRTLAEGEANLSLATTGAADALHVFVVWDNRPRKQIFFSQSDDGGESWEQPTIIEGPTPGSGLVGPFNIQVGANQDSVVLVWQSGRPGGSCTQIYQSSSDAGVTWSTPQTMIEDLVGCMHPNQFVAGLANLPETPMYFMTETQDQVYLSAWNGRQWSQPQAQPILSGFEEPEIYTEVLYGCRRASLSGQRLYMIGCDEGAGGDVWVTSRELGAPASWFEPPVWSGLSPITDDSLEMENLKLIDTEDGLIHAFFSQIEDSSIYYTFWNGQAWSRVVPVLTLPDGEASQPEIATGPGNELFLTAIHSNGALYFSRASSGNASSESRWANPTRIEIAHDGDIGSANVAWDSAGTIFVAYSVPVNEERGIYLIHSKDNGKSWSKPLQVFNGADAGFDLVGAPSLLIMEPNLLHITWEQLALQGNGISRPFTLYYARSEDSGLSFSDAKPVVEEQVDWQEIVADDKGNLHLLWQTQNPMATVWDQVSFDGGRSWQLPQGLPTNGMATAIMVDSLGRLHFVDAGVGSLDHWRWDGNRWQPEIPLSWSLTSQQPVQLLAATANKEGNMVVVLEAQTGIGDAAKKNLLYSTRTLQLLSEQTAIQEVATQTLAAPTLPPLSPTPEPSLTLTATVEGQPTNSQTATDQNESSSQTSPYVMALIPVALLLLSVLAIVIRRVAKDKEL